MLGCFGSPQVAGRRNVVRVSRPVLEKISHHAERKIFKSRAFNVSLIDRRLALGADRGKTGRETRPTLLEGREDGPGDPSYVVLADGPGDPSYLLGCFGLLVDANFVRLVARRG